jgi:hypothetical protein
MICVLFHIVYLFLIDTMNTNANAKEQVVLGRGIASLVDVVSGERTGIQ